MYCVHPMLFSFDALLLISIKITRGRNDAFFDASNKLLFVSAVATAASGK